MNFTYSKTERLSSKIFIEKIFESGFKCYNSHFKVLWMPLPVGGNVPVLSLVSVSKRRFRRANKRNLLKRRIKEAFRLNKNNLYTTVEQSGIKIGLIIIYNINDIADFKSIESSLKNIFDILIKRITQLQIPK